MQEREPVHDSADERAGFTYFHSFEALLSWSSTSCSPAQKAHETLVRRHEHYDNHKKTSKVLLIHDFASGYHDYESQEPQVLNEPPYTCNYLQFVDTFVYFTHNLVSVPPPTWIDCLHRNGVKVLGTFLVEPQTLGMEWILHREIIRSPSGRDVEVFPVAEQLRKLAETIGFDGWLINIEKEFPSDVWDAEVYLAFLRQLKADHSMIVYYDALTISNTKSAQNMLTRMNSPLFEAAGHILLNYRWNPSYIQSSLALTEKLEQDPEKLFFGVDMWAQNRPRSFWHPRVTWPASNGGGTNTGLAVKKLAEFGVSAGLFAPAWTYQHFQSEAARLAAERAVWLGDTLPPEVDCGCQPGWFDPKDPHRTTEYEGNGVVQVARQYPAGDSTSFHTDFNPGFREEPKGVYNTTLGLQSISPLPVTPSTRNVLTWEIDAAKPCLILKLLDPREDLSKTTTYTLRLFDLQIQLTGPEFAVQLKHRTILKDVSYEIVFEAINSKGVSGRAVLELRGPTGEECIFNDIVAFESALVGGAEPVHLIAVYIRISDPSSVLSAGCMLELHDLAIKAVIR